MAKRGRLNPVKK